MHICTQENDIDVYFSVCIFVSMYEYECFSVYMCIHVCECTHVTIYIYHVRLCVTLCALFLTMDTYMNTHECV